jgi:hypothetical protein
MNLGKRRLLLRSLCLTVASLVWGCKDIPELHPHVADFKLNEAREYKVIDKKNLTIKFKQAHPLETVHNMWCLPAEDIKALKDYWKEQNSQTQGEF